MELQELKKCVSCGKEYPIASYPTAGMKKGKFYRRRKCQKCYHGVKVIRRQNIRKWVKEYRKKCECKHCGTKDFRVFEFHHVLGDKDFCIGDGIRRGYALEKIERELKKCICLCANCHRIEHYTEIDG